MSEGSERESPATPDRPRLQAIVDHSHPDASPRGGVVPPAETRFRPGQSGNPGGKPKGASILGPLLREMARRPDEDGYGSKAVELAKRLAEAALEGDREAVDAILKLMDRTDGPVEKKIEHTGELTTKRIVLEPPHAAP